MATLEHIPNSYLGRFRISHEYFEVFGIIFKSNESNIQRVTTAKFQVNFNVKQFQAN